MKDKRVQRLYGLIRNQKVCQNDTGKELVEFLAERGEQGLRDLKANFIRGSKKISVGGLR